VLLAQYAQVHMQHGEGLSTCSNWKGITYRHATTSRGDAHIGQLCLHMQASTAALALFEFGQAEAAKRGLLLVDTKYEMARSPDGSVVLVDEVHIWLQNLAAQTLLQTVST
jgi:phosphoribosylaminoimidazole-succinocarboxamide synthase